MKMQKPWRNANAMLLFLVLSACTVTHRPTPPPVGEPVKQAWGSVPILSADDVAVTSLSESLISSLRAKFEKARADNVSGKIPYRALTLSGGGS